MLFLEKCGKKVDSLLFILASIQSINITAYECCSGRCAVVGFVQLNEWWVQTGHIDVLLSFRLIAKFATVMKMLGLFLFLAWGCL